MKKRLFTVVVSVLAICIFFAACGGKNSKPSAGGEIVTDREGNQVTLPEKIEKIICLSPAVTQIIIDLGLEDKLVAVDVYSAPFLSDAMADKVMQFDLMQPDPEQLAFLEADIAFVTGMSLLDSDDPLKPLQDMGLAVIYVPVSNTFEEIREDLLFIGNAVGKTPEAQSLIKEMDSQLEIIKKIGANIENKQTVYFEIAPPPEMYSFGKGVFLNEIIETIGAENIFAENGWFSVTPEAIAERDPDVMLTNVDFLDDPVADIENRAGFTSLSAVVNSRVYQIDGKTSTYTNHKVVEAAKEIALAVYPEEYKELVA